ncbi:hypothetical protein Y1Q_0024672 [Alligator mississippiensis]|uniref:ribonuclease H n=1 Tax=Alligator mississippiensis TaxID=8496 RepID=A0A151PGZ5_ALLMI|nr:hypothetical protein Y1Q_0024672 [Alligator mississippiensis]
MGRSGDKRKAPLQPLPIIDQPFQRVGIDIVGPLRHKTHRGKKCFLTPGTELRNPLEAIALTSTKAPVVADVLTKIFFQLGFPSEILTDRGGNFLAELMKCLWECCGVKHLKTTAYHPQTDGLVERFSGTWKEGSPEDPEEPVMYDDWDGEAGTEELCLPDHLPSQEKDKLLAALKDFETVFSNKPGFWQMALDPDTIAKSAFTTPVGLYEFTVLPFGMCNSPVSFQRLINNLLQGCEQFAMAYIDDIAIFSQDFELHLIHLTTVLGQIKQAGLTVKAKKCQWALSEVVYLGHCVGEGYIAPLWDKIEAIRDWPPPQTKKQVRAFLGLAGYYRQFVPGFGVTAAPLHELTKKGSPDPVVWKQGCQEAFNTLKAALIK